MRLLSYNVRFGGTGREREIASVITACAPDVVVLQEATSPAVVQRVAEQAGMEFHGSQPGESLGYLSHVPVVSAAWQKPFPLRRGFLQLDLEGVPWRVFGLHLSAIHSNWTERRRVVELRTLLQAIHGHDDGPHLIVGDFNTLAPGEELDVAKLPYRFRAVVWVTGGRIRWRTIQLMLDAGYSDAWRTLHPEETGYTFPTWDRHVRLDYAFLSAGAAADLRACEVMDVPDVKAASDHHPLLVTLEKAT